MKTVFRVQNCLLSIGIVLTLAALLGSIGIMGPLIEQSIFGKFFWIDSLEGPALLLIGSVSLLSVLFLSKTNQRIVAGSIAAIFLSIATITFFTFDLFQARLQFPADTLFHGILGIWSTTAVFMNT